MDARRREEVQKPSTRYSVSIYREFMQEPFVQVLDWNPIITALPNGLTRIDLMNGTVYYFKDVISLEIKEVKG